ncbi:MAG: filamentous hemagglutinin N-terminal domain-containing protein [Phycisphaerales bacterium JB040]
MADTKESMGLRLRARAGGAVSRWSRGAAAAGVLAVAVATPCAVAGPTGETVVVGDVTFTRNGDHLTITASDGSVIEYDSFNLSLNEIVTFLQPGADARVFNHILGSMPSQIDGSIFANGIVYFVNPAGVVFGPTAVINVGGIYAAAAELSRADFIAGRDHFTNASGAVVNHGEIVGSRIPLLGSQVHNHGSLRADGGLVMLAAGDSFFVSQDGSGIMVRVDGRNAMLGPSAGATTPGLGAQAGVLNTGWIDAGTGTAVLAAGDLYALSIHNLGSVVASGGSVHVAANDGLVVNDGTLDASASGDAGSVVVRGPSVINRGSVLADSAHGAAGYAELTSQHHTLLLGESLVSASGGAGHATGGEILIHSYNGLSVLSGNATLSVSGGARGGDAGFMEFSGYSMVLRGNLGLEAADGFAHGTLLIDPYDLFIVETLSPPANDNLDASNFDPTGLLDFTEGSIIAGSTNEIAASTLEALDEASIILQAVNDIFVQFELDFTGSTATALTLEAGRNLQIDHAIRGLDSLTLTANANIIGAVAGGDVVWNTGAPEVIDGLDTLTVSGENVTLGANLTFTNLNSASLTATAGDVTANFSGDLVFSGSFEASGQNILLGAGITSITSEGLTLDGTLTSDSVGVLTLDAGSGTLTLGDLLANTATGVVLRGGDLVGNGSIGAVLGDISIETGGTVSGSVLAGGSLDVTGALTLGGSASAAGDINASSDLIAGGAISAGGLLDVQGDAGAGADVTAGTTINVAGGLTLSGAGLQTVEAGGQATFGGLVDKASGDLAMEAGLGGGGILVLGGGASAAGGALTLNSDAEVAGDLISGADLTLDNSITLTGTADQTLSSGGTLTIAQAINKAQGNLNLNGDTAVDVDASVTLGSGVFQSTGGTFDNTGFAITADSITISHDGAVTVGGDLLGATLVDVRAGAGNGTDSLSVLGVTVQGATVALRAGDGAGGGNTSSVSVLATTSFNAVDDFTLEQDGAIDTGLTGITLALFNGGLGSGYTLTSADSSVTVSDGTLPAGLDFAVNAADAINVNAALNVNSFTSDSGGLTTFNSGVTAAQAIAVTGQALVQQALTAGSTLTFAGPTSVNNAVSANGALTFQDSAVVSVDIATNGSLAFQNGATFTSVADQSVSGASVAFDLGASKADGSLTINSATTTAGGQLNVANGSLTTTGDLTTDSGVSAGQAVEIGGDLIAQSGVQVAIAGGSGIEITGDASATSGGLLLDSGTVNAGSLTSTGGGDIASTGNTTVSGDIDVAGTLSVSGTLILNGAGLQTASADGGMDLDAGLTRLGGDLILNTSGGQLDLAGTRASSIDVTLNHDVLLSGLAGQSLSAGGVLTLNGDVTKTTQNLVLSGTSILGTSTSITAGSGGLQINAPATLTGAALAGNAFVNFTGDASVASVTSANGSIDSLDALTTSGNITASNGAVIVGGLLTAGQNVTGQSGVTLFSGGSVAGDVNTAGTLDVLGAFGLGGDATANAMSFDSTLTLTGAGTQSLLATAGFGAGAITKASGDLTIDGGSGTALNGNVLVSNGSLSVSGGSATFAGGVSSVSASGSVAFNDGLNFLSALTVSSTGGQQITLGGNVTGGDLLTLETTGNTQIDGSLSTESLATDAGGTTTIAGGFVGTNSGQTYNDQVVLASGASLTSSGGNIEFAQGVTGNNALAISTTGDTVLSVGADIGSWTTGNSGRTVLNAGVTTSGSQSYQNLVVLNSAATLSGGAVAINAGVSGAGQDLTINSSGLTELRGGITLASLTTDGAGSLNLGASIATTDGFDLGESDAVLIADTSLTDSNAAGLDLANSFSGAFGLTVSSAGDLTLSGGTYTQLSSVALVSGGDVLVQAQLGESGDRIGTLSIRSGDLNSDPAAPDFDATDPGKIVFDVAEVFTTGDVLLNATGHSAVPQLATIGATGDLTIDSTGGSFVMGQNEKLTVPGTLNLNFAGGSATVGDITTLDDMIITALAIQIRARQGQFLVAEDPLNPGVIATGDEQDSGVDFVTGGVFDFSVTPTVLGGNASDVLFGSLDPANADANNTLVGFVQQDFDGQIELDLLRFDNGTADPSDDLFFDLASSGPTLTNVAEALAGALPRDTEVQEIPAETPLSMTELRLLRQLFINAKLPDAEEYLASARIGVALYDDNDSLYADVPEVTVNRLLNDRVREVLDSFLSLMEMSEEEALAAGTDDRRELVTDLLNRARVDYLASLGPGEENTPEAFHRFLSQGQYAETVVFLGRLDELLSNVADLGLTEREFRTSRQKTLQQIKPDNIPLDELEILLQLSSTRARPEPQPPVEDEAETVAALD